jgi:hypothetical protein
MDGPISFWGYKEQESNLILPEHDDDDDDDDNNIHINIIFTVTSKFPVFSICCTKEYFASTF